MLSVHLNIGPGQLTSPNWGAWNLSIARSIFHHKAWARIYDLALDLGRSAFLQHVCDLFELKC